MENQIETGAKKMVKKEENSDRFSTVANAEDRKKPLEKAKRSIGSMFRRSVKVEISPAEVENTECGQLTKPVNQEPSQPASSSNVLKKEETSDNWSTMAVPEMPLSTFRKSTTEQTRETKFEETGRTQPAKAKKFMNGALVDTSVSPVTTAVPAVPANGFMSTSKVKGANKAKRTSTIESSHIKVNSIGASSPDDVTNEHSIRESESEDHDDGCSPNDADMKETGIPNQQCVEDSTNEGKGDCDGGQFPCLDCAAVFETKAAFKLHIASHPGYRRHKCTVCDKRSNTKQNLMVHKRIHTGEKPFKCDVCKKKFTTNGELTVHMRIHTGEKPFKCDVCKKGFTVSSNLTVHKRIHTGDKPFECLICHKRFTQSGYLLYHNRIHTGKKPFKCDVCKKGFTVSSNLTVHKRIHTGEKPFECMSCGLCFRRNSNLKRHKRTQHSDADAGSQLDGSQNGMDQSSIIDACDPLGNSINGQKILYKRKSIDYVVEKMASRNSDVVYLVWSKKFTMELASAVARSGFNCILCVEKIELQSFHDVVKLSDGLHICLVEVGPDSKSLRLFSFGGMFLSEKITDHGRFKTLAKLESKMRRFAQFEGMKMVNIYKHSEKNSGWYRSLKDGLKGECIITDYI